MAGGLPAQNDKAALSICRGDRAAGGSNGKRARKWIVHVSLLKLSNCGGERAGQLHGWFGGGWPQVVVRQARVVGWWLMCVVFLTFL